LELLLADRTRLILLLAACALLASIETVVPLFRYRAGRLWRAFPNLVLALGVVLTNLALASLTASVSAWVTQNDIGLLSRSRSHPWVLIPAGVAGLDLFAYIAHRLLHKIPQAWKFHCVHHSELEVDVTTAFRQHPGETLWRASWQFLGTIVLGLPIWIVLLYLSLSGLNAILEHSNLRMNDRVDRCLRLLIVTPNMHKVHHSRLGTETDSNFSNILSFWDRIGGTYTGWASNLELCYGLDGFDDREKQTLIGLLSGPFRSF
jgi:sterol desaturase/sphingolipid hydroxylase (fatty acid hydroxylase superfamily)